MLLKYETQGIAAQLIMYPYPYHRVFLPNCEIIWELDEVRI